MAFRMPRVGKVPLTALDMHLLHLFGITNTDPSYGLIDSDHKKNMLPSLTNMILNPC
jgi:hypothetical protein